MNDDLLSSPGPLDAHLDRAQTRDRLRFLADYGVDLGLTCATLAATPSGQLSEVMDILSLHARAYDPAAWWRPSREPAPDFPRVFDAFERASVRAVLIGGMAASLRGVPYVTRDLDFCYDPASDNRRRLVDALAPLHPRLRDGMIGDVRTQDAAWRDAILQGKSQVSLGTDAGDVDLVTYVSGIGDYDQVRTAATPVCLRLRTLPALDLPDIIASKIIRDQPGDQQHIYEMEAAMRLRDYDRLEG